MIELNSPEFNLYHNSILNQFEFEFKNFFDVLNESIMYNEILIDKNKRKLEEHITKDSILKNNIYDRDAENYINGMYGDNMQHINCLEMTLRSANLICAFSLFENRLNDSCQFIESISLRKNRTKKNENLEIDKSKINISLISISEFLNVDIESIQPKKVVLFKYKEIRNSITHNSSIITSAKFEQIKDVKNLKISKFNNDNYYIHLNSDKLLFELIEIMENIYLNILQIIDEKINFDNTKKYTIRNF